MSPGLLNLSDADLSGFEPLEPKQYNAEVLEIKMDAVKNTSGEGKMPAGTPMIKVQFKITDEGAVNRRVFTSMVIPPASYDPGKAAKMKGMIARFFIALGDTEEAVRSKDFDPDLEDYVGRACVVSVGKEQKRTRDGEVVEGEWNNPVKSVKPAGSIAGATSSGLL